MTTGEQKSWRLDLLLIVAFTLILPAAGHAHESTETLANSRTDQEKGAPGQQQDQEIASLRKDVNPYYVVREKILELWKVEANRPLLTRLFEEKDLPPNVLTALALVFGETDQRASLPALLRALTSGRLTVASETIRLHTLPVFHKKAPIYPEIRALMTTYAKDDSESAATAFADLLALIPPLVAAQQFSEQRPMAEERYFTIAMLLDAWKGESGAGKQGESRVAAFNKTLSLLVNGALTYKTRKEWNSWFDGYRSDREIEQVLPLTRVYSDLLKDLRSRNLDLEQKRRTEVAALIERMRAIGEPPTQFLLDDDPSLRRMSSVTFKSMSDSLGAPQRSAAIKSLTESLNRKDLDEELYRELLTVAGPLGKKSPDEEKKSLIAAIFDSRNSGAPLTWQARIKAASAIGLLDDDKRIAAIYSFANDPARSEEAGWDRVRIDVIRLARELSVGADLIVSALEDSDPEVRGVAAVILSVGASTVNEQTVDRLLAAAAKEKNDGALTRMLQSAETIVKKKPEALSLAALQNALSIDSLRVEPVTQARLSLVLTAVRKSPGRYEAANDAIVKLVESSLNAKARAIQSKSIATIVSLPCGVTTPSLIRWLEATENQSLEEWPLVRNAVIGEVGKSKTWARDISALWELCTAIAAASPEEAALTARSVVDAAQGLSDLPGTLSLDTMRQQLEKWSLGSENKELWQNILEMKAKDIEASPDDRRLLANYGDLLEKLSFKWAERRGELLKKAGESHRACLAKIEEAERAVQGLDHHYALARISLILLDFAGAEAALAEIGEEARKSLPAEVMAAAISCLRDPGRGALERIEVIPEERRLQVPNTLAWLSCAAHALSPEMGDWARALEGLPDDADAALKKRLKERADLNSSCDAVVRARLNGKEAKEEKNLVTRHPQVLISLIAKRGLELQKSDSAQARVLAAFLVSVTKNKALAWPAEENEANMAAWANEWGKLTGKLPIDENLREVFLKPVGTHLYSLD